MATARNALHVLRLIWRQPPARRSVATALQLEVLDRPERSPSRSALAEHLHLPPEPGFLEPESLEYRTASVDLPQRSFEPVDIPWPTLFPPATQAQPVLPKPQVDRRDPKHYPDLPLSKPKLCDPLARLVLSGDLQAARVVYDDIRQLGGTIQKRFLYLPAAESCLKANDAEGFLFWMGLYPNRPATRDNRSLRRTWYPIVVRLLRRHTLDTKLLTDFTSLAARKGILPTVILPIIRHLSHVMPPQESGLVFRRALELYRGATIPSGSFTKRGVFVKTIVDGLETEWWNVYLRALVIAGWKDAATELFESSQAPWDEFTKNLVLEELDDGASPDAVEEDTLSAATQNADGIPSEVQLSLPKRIRQALRGEVPVAEFCKLIQALGKLAPTHSTFLDRFRRRFTQSPSRSTPHHSVVHREKEWWYATMKSQREAGDRQAVVRTFSDHFLWVGLPGEAPTIRSDHAKLSMSPLHPQIAIINALLPSFLDLLPNSIKSTLSAFHAAYLAQVPRLPPGLRPNSLTHQIFIRALLMQLGAEGGLSGLKLIVDSGCDPGQRAYAFVLRRFVMDRNFTSLNVLLDRMEERTPIGDGGLTLPVPSVRTYGSIWRMLKESNRQGSSVEADRVMTRAVRQYGAEFKDMAGWIDN